MSSELLKYVTLYNHSQLFINEKDDSILIEIPAGEFEMGDGEDNDCPKHPVYLDSYYIGIFTVTNRQYKKFIDETGHRLPDKADLGYPVWRNLETILLFV